jgi:hypothetical protein
VVAHAEEQWIETEGIVPIVTEPEFEGSPEPDVLLELVVTSRGGGRDHESLVVTAARPSHVHAALLLIGLEPGRPGRWKQHMQADGSITVEGVPPEGPRVSVEFRWEDDETGEERRADPRSWVRRIDTGEPLPDSEGWAFAGSQFVRRQGEERYDADYTGTLVGLAQFGSEVLAWSEPYHHDQAQQRPLWFADNDEVPRFGTEVTVRLTAFDADEDDEPAGERAPDDGTDADDASDPEP